MGGSHNVQHLRRIAPASNTRLGDSSYRESFNSLHLHAIEPLLHALFEASSGNKSSPLGADRAGAPNHES
jgi:hypothetical protein